MKPTDVNLNSYAEYKVDSNEKDPKFKIGDHVRILKYRNIFAKGHTPNWPDIFVICKIKKTVLWAYAINDLNGEEIVGIFYKKELKRQIKKSLKQKKSLKEKEINYMSNGKFMIIHLIAGLINKTLSENESILSQTKQSFRRRN